MPMIFSLPPAGAALVLAEVTRAPYAAASLQGAQTMDLSGPLLIWIGAFSGLVGFLVFSLSPMDGTLAANRVLLAGVCALLTGWLVVYVLKRWGERP